MVERLLLVEAVKVMETCDDDVDSRRCWKSFRFLGWVLQLFREL